MGEFAGMALHVGGVSDPFGGALLELARASTVSSTLSLRGQVVLEVREGVRHCVVKGVDADDYETLMTVAPELANQGLDLLSIKGITHLAIGDLETFHAAWWGDANNRRIRISSTARGVFSSSATGQAIGPDGKVIPPSPQPAAPWQESMRYYRMSELTDDLFDAFRNVYLALESLLSVIAPVELTSDGRAAQREGPWFRGALSLAHERIDLGEFLLAPSGDPVAAMYEELHDRVRNRVFHAKDGLRPFLPQRVLDRAEVGAAKDRYTRFYLRLAETVFDGPFSTGGLSLARSALDAAMRAMTENRQVGFTADSSPFDKGDTSLSPLGMPCVTLPTRVVADPRGDEYVTLMAEVDVHSMRQAAPVIGRYGTVNRDGAAGVIDSLDGELSLNGFARCEFAIAHHLSSSNRRKRRYAT